MADHETIGIWEVRWLPAAPGRGTPKVLELRYPSAIGNQPHHAIALMPNDVEKLCAYRGNYSVPGELKRLSQILQPAELTRLIAIAENPTA